MLRSLLQGRRQGGAAILLLVGAWLLCAAVLIGGAAGAAETAPVARLEPSALPARGTARTLLHIPVFGRYIVTAKSAQGVALQLVDRMRGPGPVAGRPGKKDGRLDLFLEKGDYRLRTLASPEGEGRVTLSVQRAREMNPSPAPRLVRYRLERSTLGDLQQRSYWLQIMRRQTVAVEAAGRNLADLRLWKDGNWLVDAQPRAELTTPLPGKPLNDRLLVAHLNPGLYLLTAYGGPARPWAESSPDHPLYLRFGIPELPEAGRRRFAASPFGVDRWRVQGEANFYRLELPRAEKASLNVGYYDENHPFAPASAGARISKNTVPPMAELHVSNFGRREHLVTIRREAGKPYTLQHFFAQHQRTFQTPGDYWVSTLRSGGGEDAIDATALLVRGGWRSWRLVSDSAIALDGNRSWKRRFNLLGEATLFFHVGNKGTYAFKAEGVRADLRLEPFLVNPSYHYRAPEFHRGELRQDLDPGNYVLTLRPVQGRNGKGIVTLSAGPLSGGTLGVLGGSAAEISPAQRSFHTTLHVTPRQHYRLYLNRQPGVTSGILVRRLPIDLGRALPVTQAAQETLRLEIRVPEAGTVTATAPDGSRLPFTVDGGAAQTSRVLQPGTYAFALRNDADRSVSYALTLAPLRLESNTPLPSLPADALKRLPAFPLLEAKKPYFFETERNQTTTLNVHVAAPALYRLESTGLLRMEGTLRTRTVPSLEREAANGVGRNFLIARYLGEGDYQLSVRPQGKSRGPLGVELARNTPVDGGELREGIPARRTLHAGEGLLYRFHVAKAGDYRVRAIGLDRRFTARLEDADGWPLVRPGLRADYRRHFAAGDYRLLILPQQVAARVVTLFAAVPQPRKFEGHGPHDIALDSSVTHRWMEPRKGARRIPDQWRFRAPAAVTAVIDLSPGMAGTLLQEGKPVGKIVGGQTWQGKLAAGRYLLETESAQPNNRFDYRLSLRSRELVAGETRQVKAPAELTVALGSDAPFELSSFGDRDVRAKLYDRSGTLLAENDDRANDWNFFLSNQLPAGNYRLRIEPVGASTATTAVSLRLPPVRPEAGLTLPARLRITDAAVHTYPLPRVGKGRLWCFSARSKEVVGLALERRVRGRWRTVGEQRGHEPLLVMPTVTAAAGAFRLRVWSVSRSGHPIEVAGQQVWPAHQPESRLAGGVSLEMVAAVPRPLGVAAVDLQRPGLFALAGAPREVLWGTAPAQALEAPAHGRFAATGKVLWLARRFRPGSARRLKARRVVPGVGAPLALGLPPGRSAAIDLPPLRRGATQVALAESPTGLPGIRGRGASPGMAAVGVARQSALWIRHATAPTGVLLWDATRQKVVLPVHLCLFRFAVRATSPLGFGSHDLTLHALAARSFALPNGNQRLRLALPAGVAAEVRRAAATVATFWSGSTPGAFLWDRAADRLILYNTRARDGRIGLLTVAAAPQGPLRSGRFGKLHFAAGGCSELAVHLSSSEKRAGRRLHVDGRRVRVTAIESSGAILRAPDPVLHDDARVLVDHGPGFVLAWLSDPAGHTAMGGKIAPRTVSLPAQLTLSGPTAAVRLKMAAAGGVAVSSDIPLIVRVRRPGRPEQLRVFPDAVNLPLYLPPGATTLLFDGLTGSAAGGQVELHRLAVESLTTRFSAKRLLAPGASRLFHFHLSQARTIGVGVKGSVDLVDCTLLNGAGKEVGRGLLQMHHLAAGDYLLRVEAPPAGDTVEVQAVVVGLHPPGNGPPPEVIRKYLRAAGFTSK